MRYFTILLLSVLIFTNTIFARSFRVNQIPNGNVSGCLNCHTTSSGGGKLNAFGNMVKNGYLVDENVVWNAELAGKDADGDGYTNGEELQDPQGTWKSGNPAPGNSSLVSNPGNSSSVPNTTRAEDFALKSGITINSISPNPINSNTKLTLTLSNSGNVDVNLYDARGNVIEKMYNGNLRQGLNAINLEFDGSIKSGVYFLNIRYNGFSWIEKVNIIR